MEMYYDYWKRTGGAVDETPEVCANELIYIRQRGDNNPIYAFARSDCTDGKLSGNNFLTQICTIDYDSLPEDVSYNHTMNIWECGGDESVDFMFYLSRYARGGAVEHFMRIDDLVKLREIYVKYGFTQMVSIIDSFGGWCVLF